MDKTSSGGRVVVVLAVVVVAGGGVVVTGPAPGPMLCGPSAIRWWACLPFPLDTTPPVATRATQAVPMSAPVLRALQGCGALSATCRPWRARPIVLLLLRYQTFRRRF